MSSQWILIALALLLAPAALEVFARWWMRFRNLYYVLPPGLRVRTYPDPEVFPELERVTAFEVNREGERGGEVPRSREGLYRILVAGGSQPEGFFLDQDTAWPGALQRLLEKPAALKRLGATATHVGNISR